MTRDGYFTRIGRDPRAQFGTALRSYLGATVLPERQVPQNAYREQAIRYRTVLAADGSRYSPAQRRRTGQLVGSMLVELGNQDIANEFTAQDYDDLIVLLESNQSMSAMASLINWTDVVINRALVELLEKQRWEAIVNAQIVRQGDNGYRETVTYPNPAGQRVTAGGTWSNDAYDPFDDLAGRLDFFYAQGYGVSRIIASRRVMTILAGNQKMAQRAANVRVLSTSDVFGRLTESQINQYLSSEGLPTIETYDLQWRSETATGRFLPNDVMVFVSTTGKDQTIDWGDNTRFLTDTLGYTAIGRAVGQTSPGRVLKLYPYDNKPPRIETEGWQTSLPVLTEPEAISVISGIN